MACMAAVPCAKGSRANAFMTKLEKAKSTPPVMPLLKADTNSIAKIARSSMFNLWARYGREGCYL